MQNIVDESTFEELYHKYCDELHRLAYGYVHNQYDAENIVQNVFIKYLTNNKPFTSDVHEHSWLIRVTINESIDCIRSNSRKKINYDEDAENYPESKTDNDTNNEYLRGCVDALPNHLKEVILLYYYNNYSVKDISSMLSINEKKVYRRLDAARQKLKVMMEVYDEERN